jgi:hypothetical protein
MLERLSPNFSSIEENKAALRGIEVVSPNSYAQGEERPYGNRVYTRTIEFQQLGRRAAIGRFDGGRISSDAGGLLPREVESRFHILKRLAKDCFRNYGDKDRIEHSVKSLIRQRVYGIALQAKTGSAMGPTIRLGQHSRKQSNCIDISPQGPTPQ